jgi:hypothetical protein
MASKSRKAPGFSRDVAELVGALRSLVDHYRPELHYMRGPGPKWRAKHAPAPVTADMHAQHALVRVQAR